MSFGITGPVAFSLDHYNPLAHSMLVESSNWFAPQFTNTTFSLDTSCGGENARSSLTSDTNPRKRHASESRAKELVRTKRMKQPLSVSCPSFPQTEPSKALPCESLDGMSVIESETLAHLLEGRIGTEHSVVILDCRFPYEYAGGHIRGAQNAPLLSQVKSFFEGKLSLNAKLTVIFHCEFSSVRAPEALRMFRALDRDLNKNNWPQLNFPEVYLLKGGYKEFFTNFPQHCESQNYVKMMDNEEECKTYFQLRKMEAMSEVKQSEDKRSIQIKVRPLEKTSERRTRRKFLDRLAEPVDEGFLF